jgi:hypothetical protein
MFVFGLTFLVSVSILSTKTDIDFLVTCPVKDFFFHLEAWIPCFLPNKAPCIFHWYIRQSDRAMTETNYGGHIPIIYDNRVIV